MLAFAERGYRDRALDTRLGTLNLKIPKLRVGSYFPPFLEARRTTEKALVAVIQEAWIGGVSTRKVDEIAQAKGRSPNARRSRRAMGACRAFRRARCRSYARRSTSG